MKSKDLETLLKIKKYESILSIVEGCLKEIDKQVRDIKQAPHTEECIKNIRDNISELEMFLMNK